MKCVSLSLLCFILFVFIGTKGRKFNALQHWEVTLAEMSLFFLYVRIAHLGMNVQLYMQSMSLNNCWQTVYYKCYSIRCM